MNIFTKQDYEAFRTLRITHMAQAFEALLAQETNELVEPENLFRRQRLMRWTCAARTRLNG